MKALYLNITVGCKEADRFRRLVGFVKHLDPDVLGLSELNGWERDGFAKLKRFKSETGMTNSIFCRSPHGYHVGLFSKTAFSRKCVVHGGMWHGAIIASTAIKGKGYNFAVTHLSPISEELRMKDIRRILGRLGSRNSLLLGDMNSISPLDRVDDSALLKRARELGIKKFGTDRIEKEVVSEVMAHGLYDVTGGGRAYSVPTGFTHDPDHFARLHLDYIFVTKDLRSRVERAGVIRNSETDTLSDHYPVFAQFTKRV